MFRNQLIAVSILILLSALAVVPRASAGPLSTVDQDLVQWTTAAVAAMPGQATDGFDVPDAGDIDDFKAAVAAFLDEEWSNADDLALTVGYEVVVFHDQGNAGETLYGLFPTATNTAGRGYFLLRPRAQVERRLVLEAPHPVNDKRTGVFGSEIFRATGARALLLAGTDRCANMLASSGCSGDTDACSTSAMAYRISDMAHSVDGFFQAFHELAGEEEADTVVLQIHGFKADAEDEPEFSVSDGTRTDVADLFYLPNAFAAELAASMDDAVENPARPGNSCNLAGDDDFKCGTDNVQGRFTNLENSTLNACTTAAASADARFIHLEMSNDLRDPGGVYDRQIVIDAINAVFPTQAAIGDRVWADLDGDDLQSPGEPGVDGVTVELLDGSGNLLATRTTQVGSFTFGNLSEGDYRVKVAAPAGYTFADKDAGADDADSDFDPADGRTAVFHLDPGQSLPTIDAGLVPPGTGRIAGFVWEDDGNGVQAAGEAGIGGIGVRLLSAGGATVATTTTGGAGSALGHGRYAFDDVLPGDYKLSFETGTWGVAPAGQGTEATDSDLVPQTGETEVVSVTAGGADVVLDAGLVIQCLSIGLVPDNAVWKWEQPEPNVAWPSDWNTVGFGDSGWESGFSPLGFGTSSAMTSIPVPPLASTLYASYFRLAFEVEDPGLYQGNLQLEVLRDDGVIVYLNGSQVLRSNVPAGAGPGTPASGSSRTTVTASIPSSLLATGTNVLAVQLHERHGDTNPDGLFHLKLTGTVCNPCRVGQKELTQVVAAHVEEDDEDDNFAADPILQMDGDAGEEERAFLAWDLEDIPEHAEVLQAELVLHVTNDTTARYGLYEVKRTWSEGDLTWNRASDLEDWQEGGADHDTDRGTDALAMMPRSTGQPVTVAAPWNPAGRELIERWLSGATRNDGVLLAAPGQGSNFEVHSNEGAHPPVLRVTYAVPACTQ